VNKMNERQLGDEKGKTPDNFTLDESDKELIKVINQRLGIVVNEKQIPNIRKSIKRFCEKSNYSINDYLIALRNAHAGSPILKDLVENITIGETYFFRDDKQTALLQNVILPELINKKRAKNNLSLRIWSAGCASGEELYTIIIMLHELLPDIKNWKLNFLGTDINTVVLQKALSGIYTEWSMRSISPRYKKLYLHESNGEYSLDKEIVENAKFAYLNLTEDNYPSLINSTVAQDLILCRNVLIYFDDAHIAEIMKKLARSLGEEGYLLLGASDPINYKHTHLSLVGEQGKLFSNITKLPEKIHCITPTPKKIIFIDKSPLCSPIIPSAAKPITVLPQNTTELDNLLQQSDWEAIVTTINNYPENRRNKPEILSLKAKALACLGKLDEAAILCQQSLKLDSLRSDTYFIYAMITLQLCQYAKAEEALRKTLYLDRNFVLGHYQLGLLLIHKDDFKAGIKSLKNALTIAEQKPPEKKIPDFGELTFGKLAVILKEEINIYETFGSA
jgi:chemotaxis protein methyltransferase CheR